MCAPGLGGRCHSRSGNPCLARVAFEVGVETLEYPWRVEGRGSGELPEGPSQVESLEDGFSLVGTSRIPAPSHPTAVPDRGQVVRPLNAHRCTPIVSGR